MKNVTKKMVKAWLASQSAENFSKPTQEELEAKSALFGGLEGEFQARFNLQAVKKDSPEEETFSAPDEVFESFRDALKGSKWENMVSSSKDFISKEYRLLSQTIVQDVYDFGYEDGLALKQAQADGLFDDLKFYKDHNRSVDTLMGVVGKSFFDDSKAFPVPGINNTVFVNRKLDDKFAIKFETELVDSVSVGIRFEKKPSHQFEDPFDFWMMLGREINGEIVRFLVTKIVAVVELSSVFDGADPYAKVKGTFSKDGEVATDSEETEETEIAATDSEETEQSQQKFSSVVSILDDAEKKFQICLAEKEKQLSAMDTELAELKKQVEDLTAGAEEFQKLTEQFGKNLRTFAEEGQKSLELRKEELIKFMYATGKGSFVENIQTCEDFSNVVTLHRIFKEEIEKAIPMVCSTCKGQVTRQASTNPTPENQVKFVVVETEKEEAIAGFCENVHNKIGGTK